MRKMFSKSKFATVKGKSSVPGSGNFVKRSYVLAIANMSKSLKVDKTFGSIKQMKIRSK